MGACTLHVIYPFGQRVFSHTLLTVHSSNFSQFFHFFTSSISQLISPAFSTFPPFSTFFQFLQFPDFSSMSSPRKRQARRPTRTYSQTDRRRRWRPARNCRRPAIPFEEEEEEIHNDVTDLSPSDEEEGEDLMENLENDYRRNEQQDTYDLGDGQHRRRRVRGKWTRATRRPSTSSWTAETSFWARQRTARDENRRFWTTTILVTSTSLACPCSGAGASTTTTTTCSWTTPTSTRSTRNCRLKVWPTSRHSPSPSGFCSPRCPAPLPASSSRFFWSTPTKRAGLLRRADPDLG